MITTIKISSELRDKLRTLGTKGDSYEDVLWKLINGWEDEKNELDKVSKK